MMNIYNNVFIGQSNMERTFPEIFNSEEEIAKTAEYTTIRMYNIERATSDEEEIDLTHIRWTDGWANTAREDRVADFSAVCLFFARTIIDYEGPRVMKPITSSLQIFI